MSVQMDSDELCLICGGLGEGKYLRPTPYSQDFTESFENCRSCDGTGFEPYPTLKDLRSSMQSLEASVAAMDQAIKALDDILNEAE